MIRLIALIAALAVAAGAASSAEAAAKLERVVVVMRHGVRPPTQTNDQLRKFSQDPWPTWIVAPGDLTPHGGQTVAATGRTIRAAYVGAGLLPARGCAGPQAISVWADGVDERTQMSGIILGAALSAGCRVPVEWSTEQPRDPIFGLPASNACKVDPGHDWNPAPTPEETKALEVANAKLQAIVAPTACDGGPGECFAKSKDSNGLFPNTAGFAEDLLLEYAEGMPMSDVGWGRASVGDIDTVMAIHEAAFNRIRDNVYASSRRGAAMTRVILGALQGQPVGGGPTSGPDLKLLALAGHDTNLVLMASTFGLKWRLADNPDATAPSTALAFELWQDGARRYVRAVIYSQSMMRLREGGPGEVDVQPLVFEGCASGPMGSCPLESVIKHVQQLIPAGCGELPPLDTAGLNKRS